jgi:tRNA dimethylallyltransferase
MKNTKPKILIILGPTSTGKSDLAVQLAKKYNGEIISADSRQVYKGMDLGSGKITKKEMKGVPHHLLDIVKPNTQFSVARYKTLARKAIHKILAKNKLPIICGGTGFYIDAVVNNINLPEVKPDLKLRKNLEKKTCVELMSILQKLDKERAQNIDCKNKVRLIRAIEIVKSLGKVPKIQISEQNYDPLYIGLDLSDQILKKRIAIRLQRRMKAGMLREVRRLHKQSISYRRLERFGLEYKNCALFLQGKITKAQMIENIEKESFQYVKRQRTWFKRKPNIIWLNPRQKTEMQKINKLVKEFILC